MNKSTINSLSKYLRFSNQISCLSKWNSTKLGNNTFSKLQQRFIFLNSKNVKSTNRKYSSSFFLGILGIVLFAKFLKLGGIGILGAISQINLSHAQTRETDSKGRPIYSRDEVAKHKTKETGIWITFQDGVYDVTDFVEAHPGGDKILLGAGASADIYWNLYAVHKEKHVLELLETMRIGSLREEKVTQTSTDPFANEPLRSAELLLRTQKPFNAETPPDAVSDQFYTQNKLFFVRNHLPVPIVDKNSYSLEITGEGLNPVSLTLDDLKNKFHKTNVDVTIQCSGNRRVDLNKVRPIKGLEWTGFAIGNAKWGGVKLRDVLLYAGFKPDDKISHVHFEGFDIDATGNSYGASVPIEKAFSEYGDVILAYEMNGEELPVDHGFPVRAVVPGVIGARNVKWLKRVVTSSEESKSFWQTSDYKLLPPNITSNPDYSKYPAIQDAPVQSCISEPNVNTKLTDRPDNLTVKGYAWSGGGRGIQRVDVSVDGGETWIQANLQNPSGQKVGRNWAWTLWKAEVPVPKELTGKMEIICRAVDTSCSSQPERPEPLWNLRGVLNNSWFRTRVDIPPKE